MDIDNKASRDLAKALRDLSDYLEELVADLQILPSAKWVDYLPRTLELCAWLEVVVSDAQRTTLVPNLIDLKSPSNRAH